MYPFPRAAFSSTSGQWYLTAPTNNARTATYPQPLQHSHGPYLATVPQGASTVPHDLAASSSLYAANHRQPVGYSTTSSHHLNRISSPVIPLRPEHFMTSPSAPHASTSAQRLTSDTSHIPPQHQSLRDDTPLDLTLMTPMLRIAIFTGEGEGALRSQTPVWALFINRDPDYKELVDLLTIQGSSTLSWEPASALRVSLRKCKDLVCVVELPSCSWPSYILLSAIERSQRMPQPYNIPWSSAHWVCYTIEKFAALADPAMRAPPFYWNQQLIVYDLWTTVWNAAIIHFADRYLTDRDRHASRGQSVPRLDLERIEPNGVRLHMFPERTNITQELRLARTVLPMLKGAPDRSRTLAFTFQYAVSRLGV